MLRGPDAAINGKETPAAHTQNAIIDFTSFSIFTPAKGVSPDSGVRFQALAGQVCSAQTILHASASQRMKMKGRRRFRTTRGFPRRHPDLMVPAFRDMRTAKLNHLKESFRSLPNTAGIIFHSVRNTYKSSFSSNEYRQ
jgi:hypothetical protein